MMMEIRLYIYEELIEEPEGFRLYKTYIKVCVCVYTNGTGYIITFALALKKLFERRPFCRFHY